MPEPATRAQAAIALVTHIDQLIASLRANAEVGLPEDQPGMERATELLGLHKAKLLAGEQAVSLESLLNAVAAAFAARSAVERAYALARQWGVLRAYGDAATKLRAVLAAPPEALPAGFARSSMVSVSCALCEYTYDEDESNTLLFDSIEEATKAVQAAGWTVLDDGRVLCDTDDPEHQALRTPPAPQPAPVSVCEGQQAISVGSYDGEAQLEDPDRCQTVEVDGDTVLVRGGSEMTEDERDLIADVVRTARRQAEAERPS